MPAASEVAPVDKIILRFRCYACGEPWWEIFSETIPIEGVNTVVALCESCDNRFTVEGPFWREHGKEPQETEE